MEIEINMPQMALNGLSENWLFKFSGQCMWDEICAGAAVKSRDLVDAESRRLYPTFVSISSRYSAPLSGIQENDSFMVNSEVSRFGSSFFCGITSLSNEVFDIEMVMLTAFVVREKESSNSLRKSTPLQTFSNKQLIQPPKSLDIMQKLRKGEIDEYILDGYSFKLSSEKSDLRAAYRVSPYTDYNGANLLYFAAYPTICDTVERRIITDRGLSSRQGDWAHISSTISRDIFYFGNLDLGDDLDVIIVSFNEVDNHALIHTSLLNKSNGNLLASIFTKKALIDI